MGQKLQEGAGGTVNEIVFRGFKITLDFCVVYPSHYRCV